MMKVCLEIDLGIECRKSKGKLEVSRSVEDQYEPKVGYHRDTG